MNNSHSNDRQAVKRLAESNKELRALRRGFKKSLSPEASLRTELRLAGWDETRISILLGIAKTKELSFEQAFDHPVVQEFFHVIQKVEEEKNSPTSYEQT